MSGSTSVKSDDENMSVRGSGEGSTACTLSVIESAISLLFCVLSFCAALRRISRTQQRVCVGVCLRMCVYPCAQTLEIQLLNEAERVCVQREQYTYSFTLSVLHCVCVMSAAGELTHSRDTAKTLQMKKEQRKMYATSIQWLSGKK